MTMISTSIKLDSLARNYNSSHGDGEDDSASSTYQPAPERTILRQSCAVGCGESTVPTST
ncbi:hypothetical protein E2562_021065 [Oryza meyeriana var. granulata]|uniref:Uncharacterized protein n=1 Tax=Oryza meyeriana var. granulata TaxID=110450 RepID=A0A6G1FAR0_9ORYZ|nr:hypothetical protein E2562_021065 [Oryza meyeriana var. granulata]